MICFALAPQAAHAAFLFSVDWPVDVACDESTTGIVDQITLSSAAFAPDSTVSDAGLLAGSPSAEISGVVLANPMLLLAAIHEPPENGVAVDAHGAIGAWRDAMARGNDAEPPEPDVGNVGQEVRTVPLTAALDALSLPPSAERPSKPPLKFSSLVPERPTVALVGVGLF
jgi:hypothetical protein